MTPALAVAGAGLIGRRHVAAIAASGAARLHAVVDPAPEARDWAEAQGARWFPTLEAMIAADRPDGVILATPNALHAGGAMACIAAGLPVLVEKPITTDVAAARAMVMAAAAAGVPLAVGHHRRHNPLIAAAKATIDAGRLGRIVAVQAMFWAAKPDDYFDVAWRREPGAGPVFVNLIHDVDLLRHLCGEITSVRALTTNAVRGNPVEETAAILFTFASGALGTASVSDTIVSPWSWELTARENPAYPATDAACYRIGGTEGSLELPGLTRWHDGGARNWWAPLSATRTPFGLDDPLILQIRQFARVVQGLEPPLVPGHEGLATLAVIAAIHRSAASGGDPMQPDPATP
ncbi:MAG: gfo/Idh/MocA family oxidoreductase [Rhodobacteraceae bacterium]|nr:gfo/Idh/MocA family oxidoreductase [Paracoccaceae bacterium]